MSNRPCPDSRLTIERRALLVGGSLLAAGCGAPARNEEVRSAARAYADGSPYQRFATGLDFTHRALRRNVARIAKLDERDGPATDDTLDYVALFGRFLTSHHEGEDRFVFPALRASTRLRSSDVAFLDAKAAEHREVHGLLDELSAAIDALRRGSSRSLARTAATARSLEVLLLPHLASEEEALTPEHLAAMIEPGGLREAEDRMLEHDKKGGAALLMLYVHSLSSDEQQVLLGSESWFFRRVLVKGVWRSSFSRFVPFVFNPAVAL